MFGINWSIGKTFMIFIMNGNLKNTYVECPEGSSWETEDVYSLSEDFEQRTFNILETRFKKKGDV